VHFRIITFRLLLTLSQRLRHCRFSHGMGLLEVHHILLHHMWSLVLTECRCVTGSV